ncbi:MAG: SDR family NAD(P)-dependent oxidoreductase [Anaerolineales bacterium]
MKLEGRTAMVTGGGHRLGRTIALALAKEGCRLMIHFHQSSEAAEETADEIRSLGARAEVAQADLSGSQGVHRLFAALDTAYGGLELLVNSAAILERVDLLEATEEDWQRTLGLNLKGAFFTLQQAAIRMQARGGGAIVNVSDSAAHRPWPAYPLHCISKSGLEMLTQVAAARLAPAIRVNAVVPGPTLKPVWMAEPRWQAISRATPLGVGVEPEQVARGVVFLMKNDYVTGHSLRVDAGTLLHR